MNDVASPPGQAPDSLTDEAILPRFLRTKNQPTGSQTLGFRMVAVSQAERSVEVEFDAKAELLLNPMKQIQGGYLCAMLDEAMATVFATPRRMLEVPAGHLLPARVRRRRKTGRRDARAIFTEHADAEPVSIQDLYAWSDFISLHLPLNVQTRDLIGPMAFSQMKDGCRTTSRASGGWRLITACSRQGGRRTRSGGALRRRTGIGFGSSIAGQPSIATRPMRARWPLSRQIRASSIDASRWMVAK